MLPVKYYKVPSCT